MESDHIPNVSPEFAMLFGSIDLQIEEQIRSLFEDLDNYPLTDQDRSLVIQHLRWVYYKGFEDALEGSFPPDPPDPA